MQTKKLVALIATGIFFLNSTTYAANEEDFPTVDAPFSDSKQSETDEENLPTVDEPFTKNHSSTINHTEERGKEKKSEQPSETFGETETPPPVENPPPPVENPPPPVENPPPVIQEGDGLEFLMYNENGVQAFAVVAAHEQYNLRPIIAQNHIQGRSTVSQIAGNLNDIATINASYFNTDGSLIGITKINGVIVSSDYFNRSAIGINSDGTTIFGRITYHGTVTYNGETVDISGVNCERGENRLIVYNEYFGNTTGTNRFGVEIIEHDGIITDIRRDSGNSIIPHEGHVISAHGTAAEIFANAQIGDEIFFEETILSDDADFNSAPYVLGAGPRLVRDGKIFVTTAEEKFPSDISVGRAPRSAVGVTVYGDYFFAVVDGRQAHSRGCTLEEWAAILVNKFGAFQAINLDGGGSTELVVKDKLVNSPSDGRERAVGSSLTIVPK